MGVLGGLVPVFLVLAVGVAVRRLGLVGAEEAGGLNRLVANVALPAFLLLEVGGSPLGAVFSAPLVAIAVGVTVVAAVLTAAVAALLRLPANRRGVVAQAAMRGNLAYVGFPVVLAATGEAGLRQAAVTSAVLIPVMNLLAVALLELNRARAERPTAIGLRVLINPLVASALGGLVLGAVGWQPWPWLDSTLRVLSNFALPGALLALGAQLSLGRWRGVWRPTTAASLVKLGALPLAGLVLLRWAGVPGPETAVGVLLLATPTAVASYPVAAELGGDTDLAGACVLVTTVVSFAVLPIWTVVSTR